MRVNLPMKRKRKTKEETTMNEKTQSIVEKDSELGGERK